MIRRTLVLAFAFLVLTAVPAHAQYSQVTISIPSAVVPGEFITVTLTGFPPGTPITIQILPSGEVNIGIDTAGTPPTSAEPTTTTTAATTTTTSHWPWPPPWWPYSTSAAPADATVLGTLMANELGEASGLMALPASVTPGNAIVAASAATPQGVQAAQTETAVLAAGTPAAAATPAAAETPAAAQAPAAAETPAAAQAPAAPAAADPSATTPAVAALPVTGNETAPLSLLGAGLVVAGGLVILGNRRRTRGADVPT